MFNLDGNPTAGPNGEAILRWVVWFATPFGLYTNLEDAAKRVKKSDLDPNMSIIPFPVAVTEHSYEQWRS